MVFTKVSIHAYFPSILTVFMVPFSVLRTGEDTRQICQFIAIF